MSSLKYLTVSQFFLRHAVDFADEKKNIDEHYFFEYPMQTNEAELPWRAFDTDSILLFATKNFPNIFQNLTMYQTHPGLHFIIHDPFEYPSDDSHHFFVFYQDVEVTIEPLLTLLDENLRHDVIKRRQCLYNHENPLRLFKYYSKRNCEHECESRIYEDKCKCVPFYLTSK